MLIKIQSQIGSNTFNLVENCREVSFSKDEVYSYSAKELREHIDELTQHYQTLFLTDEAVITTLFDPAVKPQGKEIDFNELCYRFNWVKYVDEDGKPQAIVFDGLAYLCNNEGRTVHKLAESGPMPVPTVGVGVRAV